MSDYDEVSPEIAILAVHGVHVSHLREALILIRQDLEIRIERHDRSKLGPQELPGFSRINAAARDHPYGSTEYTSALASERRTVEHHYAENSHHPEYHDEVRDMGWLDIIEMVCDWRAAGVTYGLSGGLRESIKVHHKRFDFSAEQWWLIEQVAEFLGND